MPQSVVFPRASRGLPAGQRPHILINCPENSGCTTLANVLCVLLRATACRVDTSARSPRWEVGAHISFVHKSIINGYASGMNSSHNTMRTQLAPPQSFTHRLLLFRDPVQNYISLVRKPWCENSGGFASKWKAVDLSFQAHYLWRLSPFYDAVLFEDWMLPQKLYSVLEKLGLGEHLIDVSGSGNDPLAAFKVEAQAIIRDATAEKNGTASLGALWRQRAAQLGLEVRGMLGGNFHPGQDIAPHSYPEPCAAVKAAARYTPHLFAHYHPARARLLRGESGRVHGPNESKALHCTPSSVVAMLDGLGRRACPRGAIRRYRETHPGENIRCASNCQCCE